MKNCFYCLLLLTCFTAFAQKPDYSAGGIAPELKENANAVVRLSELDVRISSQSSMTIATKRITTVFNESGLQHLDLSENYDKNRMISKIEAKVYDAAGNEIKSIKKRDFKDVSAGDGFSVFSDNRVLYAAYVPINYPFTVVYQSEVQTSNTAFLPAWSPVEGYYTGTQKSTLKVTYPKELGFGFKEVNFDPKYGIVRQEEEGGISFSVANVHAFKGEESSPEFTAIAPVVYMKVEKFNLEGINGQAKNWQELGKWFYDTLLQGTDEIPLETQNKIKQLTAAEKDPLEIAKIVYQYVQDKTRYVSIQVGIGGFKPMLAKDVDKLGYGDCKALSNYTRALLKVVGIPAYYTIVYGSGNRKGLQEDFASVQGNHIILAIPYNNELVWLECTNQLMPFGFQGTFTDDRSVLLVTPEGGRIVKTKSYLEKDNGQYTTGTYSITADGDLTGGLTIRSTGSQYDGSFGRERLSAEERDNYYKQYFQNISHLKLSKIAFQNDRDKIAFTQDIGLSATGYATGNADKLMFVLNAFNFNGNTPKRYRTRENPFEIDRGYYDYDEIVINIPAGYEVEAIPDNFEIKGKYGECETSIVKKPDNTLLYKRALLIKNGFYQSGEYEDYRQFREKIAKNDNAKVILSKKI